MYVEFPKEMNNSNFRLTSKLSENKFIINLEIFKENTMGIGLATRKVSLSEHNQYLVRNAQENMECVALLLFPYFCCACFIVMSLRSSW